MKDKNIVSELISFVEAGEHTKFQLLHNWQEYEFTRNVRFATKTLLKSLRVAANRQFKRYCSDIVTGTADVLRLLAYRQLLMIIDFYSEELKITEGMVFEYEAYLMEGNLVSAFLGEQRPFDKLWDHRGL